MLTNLSLSWVVPKGSQQLGNLFRAKDAGAFLRQEGGITWHAANISAMGEPGWLVDTQPLILGSFSILAKIRLSLVFVTGVFIQLNISL